MIHSTQIGEKFLNELSSLGDDAMDLFHALNEEKGNHAQILAAMEHAVNELSESAVLFNDEEPALMTVNMYCNIRTSLKRIQSLAETGDNYTACDKIKYELIPFILDCYTDLYFFGFCYPDRTLMRQFYEEDMKYLCPPAAPAEDGNWRYEVSIVVPAYNKKELSMLCLESIRKFFPKEISHELILVNTGSSDGTKELFESYHPDKQIDMAYMVKSFATAARVIEGKYILFISNDVILTPNAFGNLYQCLKSDPKIGCVAPTCTGVSNFQTIPCNYENSEEMFYFAAKNNVSNPVRWYQRSRLIPPVLLAPSTSPAMYTFWGYWYPNSPDRFLGFTDDVMSMILRQSGLKAMLARDAFVHHAGSATVKDMPEFKEQHQFYTNGQTEFMKTFDLDPWNYDNCYIPQILEYLQNSLEEDVDILSINCGFGDTPLMIKNHLREQYDVHSAIYGYAGSSRMREELPGVCDVILDSGSLTQALETTPIKKFTYIVIGNYPMLTANELSMLLPRLTDTGSLLICNTDTMQQQLLLENKYKKDGAAKTWTVYSRCTENETNSKDDIPSYYSYVREEILDFLDVPKSAPLQILELGCASGGTLARIQKEWTNCTTWGIELNEDAAKLAERVVDHCYCGNCEEMELPEKDSSFDYILCLDVLEHLVDPWKMVQRLASKLKPGGALIASIPNVTHWTVLIPYLQGQWEYTDQGILDRTHLHFFTLETAHRLCSPEGMKVERMMNTVMKLPEAVTPLYNQLSSFTPISKEHLEAYQYLICSKKEA